MGYLNLVGSFIYKEPLFRSKFDAFAENDAQLKTDGWAQNSKTLFFQAAVPVGWTQDASQNDKALRLVGSTGGGVAAGSQALSATMVLAHTHTFDSNDPSQGGQHTHGYGSHTHAPGPQVTPAGLNSAIVYNNGGASNLLTYTQPTVGPTTVHPCTGTWKTPGALTLSLADVHAHGGVTGSSLTSFVFAYCDVILGSKNAPVGTYTDLTNYWHTGDKADFDPFDQMADNDAYNYGNLMPASNIMLFGQASAPLGWTKVGSTNDRMLRVVSGGGGGVGGTQFVSSGVALAHTHTLTNDPDHTHTFPNHAHDMDVTAGTQNVSGAGQIMLGSGNHLVTESSSGSTSNQTCYRANTTNSGAGSTGAAGVHTHAIVDALADFTLSYVDVIQCSKDSAGSPYVYTDYTAEFAWKKLISKQRLNTLAKTDAYIQFHTTPVATQAFFYMPSPPAGWVKITSQHDKTLRMVTGATGGQLGGGSHNLSETISLVHTHGVEDNLDHTHTMSHTHAVDSQVLASRLAPSAIPVYAQRGFSSFTVVLEPYNAAGSTLGIASEFNATTEAATTPTDAAGAHHHDGVTGSSLTDVNLAYADVIWCIKS